MSQDHLGNPTTTRSAATLRGIDDFVGGFLAYQTRAGNVAAAADADADSVLANVYAGFSWMFLKAAEAPAHAAVYLQRAEAASAGVNRREMLLIAQLRQWIAGDIPAVQALGEVRDRARVTIMPQSLDGIPLAGNGGRGDSPTLSR